MKPTKRIEQPIVTDFIRLDSFLKLVGATPTGGQAKTWIQEGTILVNGQQCTQRGRKLYEGDVVSLSGGDEEYQVAKKA